MEAMGPVLGNQRQDSFLTSEATQRGEQNQIE